MKRMSRNILAVLLAAGLLFGLTYPALADSDSCGENGECTVTSGTKEVLDEQTPADTGESAEPESHDAAETESAAESEPAEAGTMGETEPAETGTPDAEEIPEATELPELIGEVTQKGYAEFFVASYGDDEQGDGSRSAPYASLARAAQDANAAEEGVVYVIVLTDLTSAELARFFGHDVYLCSDGDTRTVTRASGFAAAVDSRRGSYHPAMIECGLVEGTDLVPARLFVENLILDDAGRHEGTEYEEQKTDAADGENLRFVQDGILAAYDSGAAITLGSGAELRNFGGLSAVYAGGGSRVTLDDYCAVRDTVAVSSPEGLRSIRTDSASKVLVGTRATVEERSKQSKNANTLASASSAETSPDFRELLPVTSESGMSSLSFSAPAELIRLEDGLISYEVPYLLRFSLTENGQSALRAAASMVNGGEGVITVTLDERMKVSAEEGQPIGTLESPIFELTDLSMPSDTELRASFRLKDGWKNALDKLGEPMSFRCTGLLATADFAEDETLSSFAKVDLLLRAGSKNLDLSSSQLQADTKMLPPRSATVVYDPNGGEGGPGSEFVSAQTAYPLTREPAPSHADVNGKPVVFVGWTLEKDERVYAQKEEKPQTAESIDVETLSVNTVYAVYGYDENEDGVADVMQQLLTLSFDANGGEGAPDPEVKAAVADVGARFDIPQTEPTRRYYTFQGWSKKADATTADYKYDAEKKADQDLVILEDTTLYAVWKQNPTYTLYYNANGGTNAPDAQSAISEDGYVELVITSAVPTRSGYRFLGWSATRRGNAEYYAGDSVRISNGNVMLYAVWEKAGGNYTDGGKSGGGSPRTGDSSQPLVYAAAALLSLGALCVLLKKRFWLERD